MTPVLVGALAPLTPPGWVAAGEQLLAGLELGVRDLNRAGGVGGRPVELLVRDTAADPGRSAAAVDAFVDQGVAGVVGEYHSVAARAAAGRADALAVPFLCSSAVLDALTDEPTDRVARIAPAQSYGWRVYADFLLAEGHRRVAVVAQAGAYWAAGTTVLTEHLAAHGGSLVALGADPSETGALVEELVGSGASAVLLLVGHPEPALAIVRAVRRDRRLADVLVGAPAGQPELDDWLVALGGDGAGVPFLRYLPVRLGPVGAAVGATLRQRTGRAPSFVAFEGYDAIRVLARALGPDGAMAPWSQVSVEGTRGRIAFTRSPGVGVWQWAWAPVQVTDRDPGDPRRYRVLHVA